MLNSHNIIDIADQPTSQFVVSAGNIPAKVISIDCKHVIGLSIKGELFLPAITYNLHFSANI